MRRHRLQHHGTCANLRAATNFNIAEDFRARANHHTFTNFRVTVCAFVEMTVWMPPTLLHTSQLTSNRKSGACLVLLIYL